MDAESRLSENRPSLRDLPSVDLVLKTPAGLLAAERFGRSRATLAVRAALEEVRACVLAGQLAALPSPDHVALAAGDALAREALPSLRPVFNLTGTVLHTNLGRALLAEEAVEAAVAAMRSTVALEFDLATGTRGERDDHVRDLLVELTGAEDATVVNNNAAAVLLTLNTLGAGREAVVSRGELIEIGGAFRMPDIMARAGVTLIEVGTTNRTHPKDYAGVLSEATGLVLKVHTSNYRIEGFTREVPARELATIAHARGVPLVNDLGSGTLFDLARIGGAQSALAHEPTVRETVAEGADIVTFSGDKLLGGPQTGFIVGRAALIEKINRNPMKRALRVDKIRLAALEATLKLYRDPERLAARLPTLRLLARTRADLASRARALADPVATRLGDGFDIEVVDCASQIGSGALPLETLPSAALAIRPAGDASGGRLNALAGALRELPVAIIGRIAEGALLLDLRCLEDEAGFLDSLGHIRVPA
ncbi:L-seryl-tRNA(Sec) selenium transferase [Starkeya sp. 3C]|uniref:L-seryl-tRNA(Sec) selenium transferase n=1 Tax=Ancylobacter moscoviensis TaxID=2597768 RepID=A0ABY3DU23_9HYPH|nr:L-seryl-tRNA(Sec) selenium transferase [Ancylobacter moscoviensis]TSJ63915.1 L-seryl-tRNA(Sec) selenium transferase [Ancylobacter moscoviensis]